MGSTLKIKSLLLGEQILKSGPLIKWEAKNENKRVAFLEHVPLLLKLYGYTFIFFCHFFYKEELLFWLPVGVTE